MDSTLRKIMKKGFVYISDDQIESAIQTHTSWLSQRRLPSHR